MTKLKIGVIGGGAIGLLYATKLSDKSAITLFVRREEQLKRIRQNKLYLKTGEKVQKITVDVALSTKNNKYDSLDLLIIAVKSYQLTSVLTHLEKNHQNTPVLFLQNGIEHLQWIDVSHMQHVLVGVASHGAFREKENYVMERGVGATHYGVLKGECPIKIKAFLEENLDFPFYFQENIQKYITEKLFMNAAINPLTAVLAIRNGDLICNPHFKTILEEVIVEISQILPVQDPLNKVVLLCKQTANNFSSMAVDFQEGRKTEIDSILYPVIEKAQEKNKNVPRLEMLYHIIKGRKEGEEC